MRTMDTCRAGDRLTELDWLRIAAFGLLILYHAGMFYVSWDWHVKSPRPIAWLEWPMRWINPWRMPLLFLVSGAATACMAAGGRPLLARRSWRLLPPLLFGMAVVVPPQAYLEVVSKLQWPGSYAEFMALYLRGYGGFCRDDKCLALPTWNHLWFLAYLWAYTALLALALRLRGVAWAEHTSWRWFAQGTRLLWAPWLLLAAGRVLLLERFPSTHDLWNDHYYHLVYGAVFVAGFVWFGRADDRHGAWAAAVRLRGAALLVFVLATVMVELARAALGDAELSAPVLAALRALNGLRQWAPLVALLGFARVHWAGQDGAARRWLTQRVFPAYVVHQTVIVVAAHQLARAGLPLPLEVGLLLAATVAGCWWACAVAWRIAPLRPLLGLSGTAGSSTAA